MQDIEQALRCHRLRWFDHVAGSYRQKIKVNGAKRPGRQKTIRKKLLGQVQVTENLPTHHLTQKMIFKDALFPKEANELLTGS